MNIDPNKSPLDPHRLAALVFGLALLVCTILECSDYLVFKWKHSECRKALAESRAESSFGHTTPPTEPNPKALAALANEADKLADKKPDEKPADLTVEFKLAPREVADRKAR